MHKLIFSTEELRVIDAAICAEIECQNGSEEPDEQYRESLVRVNAVIDPLCEYGKKLEDIKP